MSKNAGDAGAFPASSTIPKLLRDGYDHATYLKRHEKTTTNAYAIGEPRRENNIGARLKIACLHIGALHCLEVIADTNVNIILAIRKSADYPQAYAMKYGNIS